MKLTFLLNDMSSTKLTRALLILCLAIQKRTYAHMQGDQILLREKVTQSEAQPKFCQTEQPM
jgi:hypothetical protein